MHAVLVIEKSKENRETKTPNAKFKVANDENRCAHRYHHILKAIHLGYNTKTFNVKVPFFIIGYTGSLTVGYDGKGNAETE
jgi:hypothetical protein